MINFLFLLLVFSASLGISYVVTPFIRNVAQEAKVLAKPGRRGIHTKPVPYLGGLAIYLAFMLSVLIVLYFDKEFNLAFSQKFRGFLIGATFILFLGLWDDIMVIKPIVKLTGQIIVALLLFAYKFRIEVITNPFGGQIQIPLFLSIIITVAWIIGIINSLNLIDGLDGLAAGITIISSLALISIALFLGNLVTVFLLVALAGACLGFLKYNFYPAQIFMGDAGSMFIGYILATVVLLGFQYKAATAVALLIPITALAIPVHDTFMAIIRRYLGKRSIFRADKKHLHHRLLDLGLPQKYVVLFLYFVCIYFGIIAFLFMLIPKEFAFILLVLLGMGTFIGIRTIGFIERKVRIMDRMRRKLNGKRNK